MTRDCKPAVEVGLRPFSQPEECSPALYNQELALLVE